MREKDHPHKKKINADEAFTGNGKGFFFALPSKQKDRKDGKQNA